jgi:thioester reductase-like protein
MVLIKPHYFHHSSHFRKHHNNILTGTQAVSSEFLQLFEKLKAEDNGYRKKIIAVEGDCTQPGLGLSPDNRQRIVEHVNIVFHMAATVRFNETLSVAVVTNVIGTRDMMLLCQDCTKIKVSELYIQDQVMIVGK